MVLEGVLRPFIGLTDSHIIFSTCICFASQYPYPCSSTPSHYPLPPLAYYWLVNWPYWLISQFLVGPNTGWLTDTDCTPVGNEHPSPALIFSKSRGRDLASSNANIRNSWSILRKANPNAKCKPCRRKKCRLNLHTIFKTREVTNWHPLTSQPPLYWSFLSSDVLVVISYVKNTTERGRAILGSSDRAVIGRCKTFVLPSAEHDDDAPLTVVRRGGRGGVFRRSHRKICTASSFIRTSRPLERRIHLTCYFGIWCYLQRPPDLQNCPRSE